ncbi:MAG: hypothetical protein L6V93_19395 [Clostridiales bacterium]|nr:MAG: hypothetical protein L6V93_19395 [Clostridiales bacterium]
MTFPKLCAERKYFSLDLSSMIAGTKYRGEFEERIKKRWTRLKRAKKYNPLYRRSSHACRRRRGRGRNGRGEHLETYARKRTNSGNRRDNAC